MRYNQTLSINNLIDNFRHQKKTLEFCVYGKGAPTSVALTTTCTIGEPPIVDDSDNEIFSEHITENGLEFWYSDALLEDVVSTALTQKPQATNSELLESIKYYSKHDSFLALL